MFITPKSLWLELSLFLSRISRHQIFISSFLIFTLKNTVFFIRFSVKWLMLNMIFLVKFLQLVGRYYIRFYLFICTFHGTCRYKYVTFPYIHIQQNWEKNGSTTAIKNWDETSKSRMFILFWFNYFCSSIFTSSKFDVFKLKFSNFNFRLSFKFFLFI